MHTRASLQSGVRTVRQGSAVFALFLDSMHSLKDCSPISTSFETTHKSLMSFSDHLILLRVKEKKYNSRINILIISLQLLQPLLQLFSVLKKKYLEILLDSNLFSFVLA